LLTSFEFIHVLELPYIASMAKFTNASTITITLDILDKPPQHLEATSQNFVSSEQ
jgi:hypothetical protein